ncbi:MAG TPA: hypothetical protein VF859_06445 [Burkholderiales bacterium]
MAGAGAPSLRHFIQEVLGCGCPEEVFRRIETRELSRDGVPLTRVEVGGRLLVEVFDTDDARQVAERLPGWVAAAVAERDARGFNRARIVISTARPDALQAAAQAAFAAIGGRDDRTHLHVVDRGLCQWQTS